MEKDDSIRHTEKKVDDTWKERVSQEKETAKEQHATSPHTPTQDDPHTVTFSRFLSSLAIQAMVHFGDVEDPVTKKKSKNLEVAKEFIDLLIMLRNKTRSNLTDEESKLFDAILADLQMKFVQASNG